MSKYMTIDDRIFIKKTDLKRLEHGISETIVYVFATGRKDPICCKVKDAKDGTKLIKSLIAIAEE